MTTIQLCTALSTLGERLPEGLLNRKRFVFFVMAIPRRGSRLLFALSIASVCLFQMSVTPTLALALLDQSQASAQENGDQATALEPGIPVECALQGGEKHTYEIHADAGLFLHAVVEQLGIDVALTLYAPDGKQIASMDSPNGSSGPEQISMIAESSGNYRLELASGDKSVPAGRYRVSIAPLRAPHDEDKGRITAERLFCETVKLWKHGNADSYRSAVQKFQETLPLWRAAGDRYEEALTLQSIGGVYDALGEKQKALDYYQQALPIERELKDQTAEARTLNSLGSSTR